MTGDIRDFMGYAPTHCGLCGARWADGCKRSCVNATKDDCDRCQGNGEIVTDWELYLHPPKGAPGDAGTAPCPDCRGSAE